MKPNVDPNGPSVSWQVIQDAAAGVQEAWDTIVDVYAGLVWTVARRGQLSQQRALDVSRLIWVRLHDRLGVMSPDAIALWLEQTAERECIRLSRLAPSGGAAQVRPA